MRLAQDQVTLDPAGLLVRSDRTVRPSLGPEQPAEVPVAAGELEPQFHVTGVLGAEGFADLVRPSVGALGLRKRTPLQVQVPEIAEALGQVASGPGRLREGTDTGPR